MEAETSAAPALASAAPATEETKKKMIMVAMDESEESFYALNWALDHLLTDPSSSTIITLINVQPFFAPMVYPAGPVVFAAPTVVEAVKKAQHENATRILSRAIHICKQKMVPLIVSFVIINFVTKFLLGYLCIKNKRNSKKPMIL
ncbi:uncharacterized protein LOC132620830 [Lycium barbarum]|uniref:uncharacterized protein LOC132620830 n=1 Tax=Lycium barbarum TaxID=112863 RepID=UPI00293F793D|nr:uncharacterized protein LOC132620830 [Lycium barbarum]